jgi:hypothetical protein
MEFVAARTSLNRSFGNFINRYAAADLPSYNGKNSSVTNVS